MPPARPNRRPLANSPFQPEPERAVESYSVDDRVCHDVHGLGRVVSVDAHGVTVDFGSSSVRIPSPFSKMERL